MTRTTAILGGTPAFPDELQLLRPTLPPFSAVHDGLADCFRTGVLTKGPALAEYERQLAEYLGVQHAIGVASCTLGLLLVLDHLGGGGGEVVLPSFTFMATAMAAVRAGLTPVFADIDPQTWCLDVRRAEEAISPRTVLILPVHLFGNPADEDAFTILGRRRGLPVVYDAAHGFGTLRRGRPVGAAGLAQVFSTSPTKLLITGEGGVVATGDDELAQRLLVAREYGNRGDYDAAFAGLNARLPEASALLGIASLRLLDGEARRRNHLAELYRRHLSRLPGLSFQQIDAADRSSFKDFSIRVEAGFGLSRDLLATALRAEGIHTRAYYVPAAHRLALFADRLSQTDPRLPETNALAAEILTLPCYGSMSEADVERVCACIAEIQAAAPAIKAALQPVATPAPAQMS
jgi:dTDP-4-amino-4,6-dideoxygalactose transaminase